MEEIKDTVLQVGFLGAFLSGLSLLGGGIFAVGIFAEIVLMFRSIISFFGFGE